MVTERSLVENSSERKKFVIEVAYCDNFLLICIERGLPDHFKLRGFHTVIFNC